MVSAVLSPPARLEPAKDANSSFDKASFGAERTATLTSATLRSGTDSYFDAVTSSELPNPKVAAQPQIKPPEATASQSNAPVTNAPQTSTSVAANQRLEDELAKLQK